MEIQFFLNKTTPILFEFLKDVLPKICANWWDVCVLGKLSENQINQITTRKINTLEYLDLAALLRITKSNWKEISYLKKIPIDVLNYTNEMISIRNNFAHLGNERFNKEDLYRSADTIQRFVKAIQPESDLLIELERFKHSQFFKTSSLDKVSKDRNKKVNIDKTSFDSKSEIISEIDRVKRKIPKWAISPGQINHKILKSYLELLKQNDFVRYNDLENQCKSIKSFKSNFDQMKIISDHNHAKIFDEIEGKVYLWEPVRDFIIKEFRIS